jgi:hypothetical protein
VTERFFEPSRGVLGDVLVERARHGARGEDALDGGVVARPNAAAWPRARSISSVA